MNVPKWLADIGDAAERATAEHPEWLREVGERTFLEPGPPCGFGLRDEVYPAPDRTKREGPEVRVDEAQNKAA